MLVPDDVLAAAIALRRELHRHPELSGEEHGTRSRVERALADLGLAPVRVGGTGCYADVTGAQAEGGGPVVCVRADLDALPIVEETGLPFASSVEGVMHACGHDVHTASAWAAAALLARDPPRGTVRFLFQPSEERGNGAALCVRDGALDGVAAVIGGHVDLDYPVGTVALQPGPMCAGTEHFRIVILGRGGHGARPHQGVDALLCAAHVAVGLQQIVAREVEPGQPAVVSLGVLHAGERPNILAGRAVLEGTLRAHSADVRGKLRTSVERVARGIAAASGAEAEIAFVEGNEPVVNDRVLCGVARDALDALGLPTVPLVRPNLGGEDFSELHRGRPGVYVRWGARGPGSADAPAHGPRFQVDEGVIAVAAAGLAAMARAAIAWSSSS